MSVVFSTLIFHRRRRNVILYGAGDDRGVFVCTLYTLYIYIHIYICTTMMANIVL